jgi:ubiquinone/menaquinone biosynthesis C-methylase UbiE
MTGPSDREWSEPAPLPPAEVATPIAATGQSGDAKAFFAAIFSGNAEAYRRRLDVLMQRREAGGRQEVLEAIAARSGEHILDLACGPGTLTIPLAEAVGPSGEVIGVDLAEGMLEQARSAVAGRHLAVRFMKMDIDVLQFPAGAFDAVTCGHGLHFVPNLGHVLREARRVLKPKGRFAASVPIGNEPGTSAVEDALRVAIDSRLGEPPQHEAVAATRAIVFDPAKLRAACLAAGFRQANARRSEIDEHWTDAAAYVDAAFSWWSVATRLRGLSDHVRALVREETIDAVTAVTKGAGFGVPNASVVAVALA